MSSPSPPALHPLRFHRLQRKPSLRALGRRSGIAFTKIWAFENGLRMTPAEARILGAALNVPPAALVPGSEPEVRHAAR